MAPVSTKCKNETAEVPRAVAVCHETMVFKSGIEAHAHRSAHNKRNEDTGRVEGVHGKECTAFHESPNGSK